jgi:hypothetical protein
VVLYGCETWSLTLSEEHTSRRRAFENRALRRIFGSKRNEVTGGWKKLHNEELHNVYSSPSKIGMIKIRRVRWEGHVARMGPRGLHMDIGGKTRRPRRMRVNNIKMDLRRDRIGWYGFRLIWFRIGISGGLL